LVTDDNECGALLESDRGNLSSATVSSRTVINVTKFAGFQVLKNTCIDKIPPSKSGKSSYNISLINAVKPTLVCICV
jgi:hypothetical protein